MKKLISIILILLLCTATVNAAVPDSLSSRKLYTTMVLGKSNIDAGGDKNYSGTVQYQVVGSANLTRVLKYPDNPDATSDYCIRHQLVNTTISNRFITPDATKYKGVWAVTFDMKMNGPDLFKQTFSIKIDSSWLGLNFTIDTDGNVYCTKPENIVYSGFKTDNWYNMTFFVDTINDKVGSIIKDLESDEAAVESDLFDFYLINTTEPYDIKSVGYMEFRPTKSTEVIYSDDVECVMLAYAPAFKEVYGSDNEGVKIDDGVDFSNPYIVCEIDGDIDETTVTNDSVKFMYGEREISSTFTFDSEKDIFYITPKESLVPNSEYDVVFSEDIKSTDGISFETFSASVKTMREYYSVSDIQTSDIVSGNEFTVSITLNNKKNIEANNALVAIAYDSEGVLCSINAIEISNPENKQVFPITLKAPQSHNVSKIDALLFGSWLQQKLIDVFSINVAE